MKAFSGLLRQSWAITLAGARDVADRLKQIQAATGLHALDKRPRADFFGQEIPVMSIKDAVAVIPMKGPMVNDADGIMKMFGFISQQDVAADIRAAKAAKPRVMILHADTPGGTVTGTPELAAEWANAGSEGAITIGYTDGTNASAGYYASAGSSIVAASPSAIVGCVGTIMEHVDISQMLAGLGVKVEQFKSGEYKGMGSPEVPLTDKQRGFLQDHVQASSDTFIEHVLSYRQIDPGELEGQYYSGNRAIEAGFVDFNANSLAALLTMI